MPEEAKGFLSPRAGVPGGCGLLAWVLGTRFRPSEGAVHTLNHHDSSLRDFFNVVKTEAILYNVSKERAQRVL